jgi:hypothetical protein
MSEQTGPNALLLLDELEIRVTVEVAGPLDLPKLSMIATALKLVMLPRYLPLKIPTIAALVFCARSLRDVMADNLPELGIGSKWLVSQLEVFFERLNVI